MKEDTLFLYQKREGWSRLFIIIKRIINWCNNVPSLYLDAFSNYYFVVQPTIFWHSAYHHTTRYITHLSMQLLLHLARCYRFQNDCKCHRYL